MEDLGLGRTIVSPSPPYGLVTCFFFPFDEGTAGKNVSATLGFSGIKVKKKINV